MSEDNIKTIKDEPHPCQVGTSCMICDGFIPLGFGCYGKPAKVKPINRVHDMPWEGLEGIWEGQDKYGDVDG